VGPLQRSSVAEPLKPSLIETHGADQVRKIFRFEPEYLRSGRHIDGGQQNSRRHGVRHAPNDN